MDVGFDFNLLDQAELFGSPDESLFVINFAEINEISLPKIVLIIKEQKEEALFGQRFIRIVIMDQTVSNLSYYFSYALFYFQFFEHS